MRHVMTTIGLVAVFTLTGCGKKATPEPSVSVLPSASPTNLTQEITITRDSFEPATVRIKQGTTVTWQNNDSATHWVSTDPHPIHTGLAGFDSKKAIEQGQSYSFTFTRLGEWPYHDHLRPVTYTGTVIVEE